MTIFPIVFTFGFAPEQGPGLIFRTLPVLFAKLPATLLLSTLFFTLVLFAALTSTISLLEVLVANLIENFKITRTRAAWACTGCIFLLGIPSALTGSNTLFPNWKLIYGKDFLSTVDYLCSNWAMPVGGLLTTLFLGWFYNKAEATRELFAGSKAKWLAGPWFFIIRYIAPLVVILIILQEAGIIHI